MDELLLWLGRLALVVALLPAFFTTWFLAGADDTPRNSVAPFVGFRRDVERPVEVDGCTG